MAMMRADCSKQLGQLLLKGWAMLAENCPQCHQVPLMRNPASKERHCVNCDVTLPPAGAPASTAPVTLEPHQLIAGQNGHVSEHSDQDYAMGPFARQSKTKQKDEQDIGAEVDHALGAPNQALSDAPHVCGQNNKEPAASQQVPEAEQDVSALLSDKMLQGWTLLDKYCPRCSTVLVRSKQKRMFCVCCDSWVVTEAEMAERQAVMSAEGGLKPVGAAAASAAAAHQPQQPGMSTVAAVSAQTASAAPQAPKPSPPPAASEAPQAVTPAPAPAPQAQPQVLVEPQPAPASASSPAPPAAAAEASSAAGASSAGAAASPPTVIVPQRAPSTAAAPASTPVQVPASTPVPAHTQPAAPKPTQQAATVPGLPNIPIVPAPAIRTLALAQQLPPHSVMMVQPQQQQQASVQLPIPVHSQAPPALPVHSQTVHATWGAHATPPSAVAAAGGQAVAVAAADGGLGGNSGGARQLFTGIGRTLLAKMSEAERLLADTPAGDADKCRGYVMLISDCLNTLQRVRAEVKSNGGS